MNATHFEFDLNDKIGGSEGETTPEPSLCNVARISREAKRERYLPSVIAHYGSTECVCWNSVETRGSEVFPEESKTETYHIRVGAKVPPP